MAIWIRRVEGSKRVNHLKLANDDWDLRSQFIIFENWLLTGPEFLESGQSWIADIGFDSRVNATGGGPVITQELMSMCLKHNITIHLSEFGE